MKAVTRIVDIEGQQLIAAGYAPFLVQRVDEGVWIVTGREGDNCVAYADGIRAFFYAEQPAVALCQSLNEAAGPANS